MGLCFYNIAFLFSFDKKYPEEKDINVNVKIISLGEETNYYYQYTAKTSKNEKFIVYLPKAKLYMPGEVLEIEGEFRKVDTARNYKGFNYRNYLKQFKIHGIITARNVNYIKTSKDIYFFNGIMKKKIISKINMLYEEENANFLKGILIGDSKNISKELKENFRDSSISHILAISGLHISYISAGGKEILSLFIKSKKKKNILLILFLIFFAFFTGGSPSCVRACIMNIMFLISELVYRKNNFYRSFLSALVILLFINPFNIYSIGMWLSFLGTLGIVLYSNLISKIIYKKIKKFKNIIILFANSFSAQIMILPMMIYHFNTVSFTFYIPNIFVSYLIGPILILGYLSIFFPIPISFILSKIEALLIKILFIVAKLCSKIPFSKIYLKTPNLCLLFIYYGISFYLINSFQKKKFYYLKLFYSFHFPKEKIKKYVLIIFIIIFMMNFNVDKRLKVYFVDVGQGDCCLIKTPNNKTIVIDGGEDFDGKIVLPYLLDRGMTKIDYMIISHFDSDHVGGLLTVMEELKVGQVVISKQGENSENFRKFKEIVKDKKIRLEVADKENRLQIEKNLYFDILWPNNEKLISENSLNNNSIVCKFCYKDFSILFTGDIEEIAEKQILLEYKDNLQKLNATILKVGHHGSKTSSTQEFMEAVKPKIALIGVGGNNKFGHPNDGVIERLENLGTKIYRTDQMGEISIMLNSKGKIKVKKFIK